MSSWGDGRGLRAACRELPAGFSKVKTYAMSVDPLIVAEGLFAPCRLELVELSGEVLGVGRNAGIAVNLPAILQQIYETE